MTQMLIDRLAGFGCFWLFLLHVCLFVCLFDGRVGSLSAPELRLELEYDVAHNDVAHDDVVHDDVAHNDHDDVAHDDVGTVMLHQLNGVHIIRCCTHDASRMMLHA